MDEEVRTRFERVEGRVETLEHGQGLHARTIFGGVDDDGDRTVSVLEQMKDIAASTKSIEATVNSFRQTLQRIAASAVKIGFRVGWVIASGFIIGAWQLAVHWDKIARALHELSR